MPLALLTVLSGCAGSGTTAPASAPPLDVAVIRAQLARDASALAGRLADPDAFVRAAAVRALGRMGGDEAAVTAAGMLSDPDAAVRRAAAFAVGASGSDRAPSLLEAAWPTDPAADTVELAGSAAMGLGYCRAPEAEGLLLSLAARPDRPIEVPGALFSYYRWRGSPAPRELPDVDLLAYAGHADPAGRAGIGWLGRVFKDQRLLDALLTLSADADPEVRRAAALGLANGRENEKEPEKSTVRDDVDAARAVARLVEMIREPDPDARVVVSAVRALASYGEAPERLSVARGLIHADFNVRAAAAQALARMADGPAGPGGVRSQDLVFGLRARVREDLSVSARYEAAVALAAIDPEAAAESVEGLLADPLEYGRLAGVAILAEDASEAATATLVRLSREDPHVRVRETALEALGDRKGDEVIAAIEAGLADSDPVVVSVACSVAVKNELADLYPAIRAVPERFPSPQGADAREGAIGAIAELARPEDRAWLTGFRDDPMPGVRWAATQALAGKGEDAEKPDARAPDQRLTVSALDAATEAMLPRLTAQTTLVVETDTGTFRILLAPDEAPVHCAHVAALAEAGFYDGLAFHRVVPDFVIQGGCPRGDGAGGAGVSLPLEPTSIPYERGTLGMPRSGHPDTGGCQLFLCHSRAPHLDVHYTAFGRVVEGLDVIDRVDVDTVIRRIGVEGLR